MMTTLRSVKVAEGVTLIVGQTESGWCIYTVSKTKRERIDIPSVAGLCVNTNSIFGHLGISSLNPLNSIVWRVDGRSGFV